MSNTDFTPATLPPGLFPDDKPRTRLNDPITSHAAADSNTNRQAVEDHVAFLFAEYGFMTDEELTDMYFRGYEHPPAHFDSPRKRRSDLTGKGAVVVVPNARRKGPTGRLVNVYGLREDVEAWTTRQTISGKRVTEVRVPASVSGTVTIEDCIIGGAA